MTYIFCTIFKRVRKISSLRPHGATLLLLDGFLRNFVFLFFPKICRWNSSFIKSGKNNRYFACWPIWIFHHSDQSCRANQNTFCFRYFFYPAFYKIMWENIVEPGRPQMTTWRTRIACWTYGYKHPSVYPYMALQPLPGLGLPHKTPPFIPIFSFSPSSFPQQL